LAVGVVVNVSVGECRIVVDHLNPTKKGTAHGLGVTEKVPAKSRCVAIEGADSSVLCAKKQKNRLALLHSHTAVNFRGAQNITRNSVSENSLKSVDEDLLNAKPVELLKHMCMYCAEGR